MRQINLPWVRRRTGNEETMSKVRRTSKAANEALAQQQAAGTHNPATQCSCGTMRTPGQTHTKGDTGVLPKGVTAPTCNK